jgi:hypothetical protein
LQGKDAASLHNPRPLPLSDMAISIHPLLSLNGTYQSALTVCRAYPGVRQQRIRVAQGERGDGDRILFTDATSTGFLRARRGGLTSQFDVVPLGFNHVSTCFLAPSSPPEPSRSSRYPWSTYPRRSAYNSRREKRKAYLSEQNVDPVCGFRGVRRHFIACFLEKLGGRRWWDIGR